MFLNDKFETLMRFCLMLTVVASLFVTFVMPVAAVAQSTQQSSSADTKIVTILCNVTKAISGNIGKTIAILVVISIAIGLFLGKVTWGVAIAVAVGMGILFGAEGIVKLISGDTNQICTP